METHTVSPRTLCFDRFILDLQRCALLRGQEEIRLRPRSFDVLRYLAEHAGRLVFKEELIQAIWPSVSVTDDSLVQCIRDVRRALSDTPHRIIRTVPRRGYLFAAEVSEEILAPALSSDAARDQEITFCRAPDGVNIAVASAGRGKPLIFHSTWLNHIEYEWQHPLRAPLLHFLANRFRLIRFDVRGVGLSDRDAADISFEGFGRDLETVFDTLDLRCPALIGIAPGAPIAIAHAVRYPERVSKLVLHGAYALGRNRRHSPQQREMADALIALMQQGWGDEHSAFMRMFSTRYLPSGSPEQITLMARLAFLSTSRENALKVMIESCEIDVLALLPKVSVPTLVLHCQHDSVVPFDEGRRVAMSIPNARFVSLESENHIPLPSEPAWAKFTGELLAFLSD
jgi:DNA-binding winged helix-turn-helix (wHTH) protein/pimeloyl-ACP methyl ester carboxylesterase